MATPRLDSSLTEYTFTKEELAQAQLLNPLQVMYLQTKYALIAKLKLCSLIPTSSVDDRDFLLSMGKLEGKLELLEELFNECEQARKDLATPQPQQEGSNLHQEATDQVREIAIAAERAANMVHVIQQT